MGVYIEPVYVVIGSKYLLVRKKSKRVFINKEVTLSYVPLRDTLKQLFLLPDFLNQVKKYIHELNSETGILSNFIQGEHWKNKLN